MEKKEKESVFFVQCHSLLNSRKQTTTMKLHPSALIKYNLLLVVVVIEVVIEIVIVIEIVVFVIYCNANK